MLDPIMIVVLYRGRGNKNAAVMQMLEVADKNMNRDTSIARMLGAIHKQGAQHFATLLEINANLTKIVAVLQAQVGRTRTTF